MIPLIILALSLVSEALPFPPLGAQISFEPSSNGAIGLRHCNYVCSADKPDGSDDFNFIVIAAANGVPTAVSFQSVNFPDLLLSPIPGASPKVGINSNADNNDASWLITPDSSLPSMWVIATQSKNAALAGTILSLSRATTNPCSDGPDVVLSLPGSAGIDAQSWSVTVPPPPPPTSVRVDASTVLSILSPTILGCHLDEGYMHAPQSFLSQMIYGEAFEITNGLRSGWSSATEGSAMGSAVLDPSQLFSVAQVPSMKLTFTSGTGLSRLAHRGMGNEGFFLQGSKDYEGFIFARADTATILTVALRDYSSGVVLSSSIVNVPAGGGWNQFNYSLTPSSGTQCVGIASDPDVDCNNEHHFTDYVCVKCGGEISYSLSGPGTVWIGYARLEPGTWGRWEGLPVRIEAVETLQAMGVAAVRYGGTVGQSVSWKDFRGPVWNRTGLGRTWASSDMSGWGPFDAMNIFETINVNVTITMSMSQTPDYFADLVEYSLGDVTTQWGNQRIADGHPNPYLPYAWELGNEQENPNFVAQVAAMEAKAAELGHTPSWFYMYPSNGGMSSAQQAAAIAAGLPIKRIATDVHVGATGGIQEIAALYANNPTFPASAINGEVNAMASALGRALTEAADINAWLSADVSVLNRTIARTAVLSVMAMMMVPNGIKVCHFSYPT